MPYWGEGKIETAQGTMGRGIPTRGGGAGAQWLNAEERGAKYLNKNQNEENYQLFLRNPTNWTVSPK